MRLKPHLAVLALAALIPSLCAAPRPDRVIADFEGEDYGEWRASGEAFGNAPARGTLPNQQAVSGYLGRGLVNSYRDGDRSQGRLTSPPFKIERRFINFLIGGGSHPETCIRLRAGDSIVRSSSGYDAEALDWETWDVSEFDGKEVRIEIVDQHTGGWGHINVDQIVQSDERRAEAIVSDELWNETYRPQFHFSARENWHNDPNGLVFYKGTYHLFFQHNPEGINWGNMTWGHATSPDLVHWKQQPHAIERDALGTIFSGSAVVDWNNTAGFQTGDEKVLVAIYTAAGGTSPESKDQGFTQCLAFSNDRGVTWTKYSANPVLRQITPGNRDPRVFWHEPTKAWIMALYVEVDKVHEIHFFSSPNLKTWSFLSKAPGFFECPDIFELPVDGEPGETRWVLLAADGNYWIGRFDGRQFTKESGKHTGDYGKNFYASQTYSDIPKADGRRIQIAWMRGGRYPRMPFNQQMSFPCELTLKRVPEGIRMCRRPVREIETMRGERHHWANRVAKPGENLLAGLHGDLFEVRAEIEPGEATAFGVRCRGEAVSYSVNDHTLRSLGQSASLPLDGGSVKLTILVDRSSLEVFGNDGLVSMTSCFLPKQKERGLELFAEGGPVRVRSLEVFELNSVWPRESNTARVSAGPSER